MWTYRVQRNPALNQFTVYWQAPGERYWRFLRNVTNLRQASDVMKQHRQDLRQLLRNWTR